MDIVHLNERKTHRYVDSYRHLDREEYVCTMKLTPPVCVIEPKDFDDGGTYVRFGRIPAGTSAKGRRDIVKAAQDTFSHWGCAHEHDCCGCQLASSTASIDGRRLRIETRISFNY